jgi:hypothetical protein
MVTTTTAKDAADLFDLASEAEFLACHLLDGRAR